MYLKNVKWKEGGMTIGNAVEERKYIQVKKKDGDYSRCLAIGMPSCTWMWNFMSETL